MEGYYNPYSASVGIEDSIEITFDTETPSSRILDLSKVTLNYDDTVISISLSQGVDSWDGSYATVVAIVTGLKEGDTTLSVSAGYDYTINISVTDGAFSYADTITGKWSTTFIGGNTEIACPAEPTYNYTSAELVDTLSVGDDWTGATIVRVYTASDNLSSAVGELTTQYGFAEAETYSGENRMTWIASATDGLYLTVSYNAELQAVEIAFCGASYLA